MGTASLIDRVRSLARGRRALFLVAAAVALLAVVAAATPDGLAILEVDEEERVVVPDPPALLDYVLIVFGSIVLIGLLTLRVIARRENVLVPRRNSGRRLLVALVFLLLLWRLFPQIPDFLDGLFDGGEEEEAAATPSPRTTETGDEIERTPSSAFGWALTALVILAGGAFLVLAARLFRAERYDHDELADEPPLLAGIDAGIDDLETIVDPREAVIRCYARMERLVPAAGVRRRPADAPFELLARLLEARAVSGPSARRLTELFEDARFSERAIDEAMRREALKALRAVRDEIGALR